MNHLQLFNTIAPAYAWFYSTQVRLYTRLLKHLQAEFQQPVETILDVGCGTGAMVEVLSKPYQVIGVDGSARMLAQAKKHLPHGHFQHVDFTQGLPFPDQHFDVVYASFVLHGVPQVQRLALLQEMKRVCRHQVIVFDYHEGRNPFIDAVEWLEHGDYFNFLKTFREEFHEVFPKDSIRILNKYSALYVGNAS